jgi:hypothetical protein
MVAESNIREQPPSLRVATVGVPPFELALAYECRKSFDRCRDLDAILRMPNGGTRPERSRQSKRDRQLNSKNRCVSAFVALSLPQILGMRSDRQIAGMVALIIQLQ